MARARLSPWRSAGTPRIHGGLPMVVLMLALVLATPMTGAAQSMETNASAPAAGNVTSGPAVEVTVPEVTEPVLEDSQPDGVMGNASEHVSSDNAESAPTEAGVANNTLRTKDGVEARGAMPERGSTPQTAEKPAPGAQQEPMPLPNGSAGWTGYFQALGAIFLILAVLAGGFFLLKRFGPRAAGGGVFGRGTLQLEAQLPLGPRRSVVVVRFLNKRLVLGVTDSNITLLTETETGNDDEVPEHTSPAQSGGSAFSKMLAKARNPRT